MFTNIYYSLGCYLLKITSSDVSIGMVTIFRLNHLIFCIFHMRFSRYKIGIINSKDSYWIKWAFPPHLTFVNDTEKHFLNPMGLSGLEPPTSRLSGVRSNQLSYKPFLIWRPPALPHRLQCSTIGRSGLNHRVRDGNGCVP